MADWKIIGLFGLFNAVVSVIAVFIFFPLAILGPLAGGFLATYYSRGYDDYYGDIDLKDAMVIGVLSGIIGGLLAGFTLIFATGTVAIFAGFLNTKLGALVDSILAGFLILQIFVVVNMVLGALGGLLSFKVK